MLTQYNALRGLKGGLRTRLVYPLVSKLVKGFQLSFTPLALFSNGEQGAFYIPKPIVLGTQSLFQDAAGTTPVTADGGW